MSGVVVVELRRSGGRTARLVVNVARDCTAAATEQAAVADRLTELPGAVSVLERGSAPVNWFGRTLSVDLLAVRHAPGREVHPVAAAGATRLVLVDRFDDAPGASVPAIAGRLLDDAAADAVWSAVVSATTRAATFSGGTVTAPAIELADGDVVAEPGGPVTIVAAEPVPWTGPAPWWPYRAALVGARNDRGGPRRLYWGRPNAALAALRLALPAGGTELLRAAAGLGDDELGRIAAAHGDPDPRLLDATRELLTGLA
jgi:hypothetical protein